MKNDYYKEYFTSHIFLTPQTCLVETRLPIVDLFYEERKLPTEKKRQWPKFGQTVS